MAYVALYRKYRSQSFDELMGQEAVTTTLRNAIASGRFGHAYLFYGARGCGKTSTARLLARALNCVAQDGPTPNPCGRCRLCTAIRDGICMDVIEMDAASETGIDDVREKVIENVQYAPGEARYKVYIIDEVHDLSSKAFDALLKTLEEPPAHVVFVLATTEYHKVPITIRSRCQGFQFKRGTLQDLSAAVARVVQAEGCSAEPEAVEAIARSAEGSWRDALSILEQVLAYSDGHITAETVHRAVGTVGAQEMTRVTETLAHGHMGQAIDIAGELMDRGTDARQLLTALQGHLRDLMLLSAGADQAAQEMGPDRLALLRPQARLFSAEALMQMSRELSTAEREVRTSNHHRWILERTLALLQAIAHGGVQRVDVIQTPAIEFRVESAPTPDSPAVASASATPTMVPRPQERPASALSPEGEPAEEEMETAPVVALHRGQQPSEAIPTETSASKHNGSSAAEPAPAEAPAEHRFAEEVTLDVIRRSWERILKLFEKASPMGGPYLRKAEVSRLDGRTVVLSFKEAFPRDRIQSKGKELVEKKLNEGLKTEGYKVLCVLDGQGGPAPEASRPEGSHVTGTLIDAPVTPAAGPTRIMDLDLSAAMPPEPRAVDSRSVDLPDAAVAKPVQASNGMLAETLNIFGGEVVKSEPMP